MKKPIILERLTNASHIAKPAIISDTELLDQIIKDQVEIHKLKSKLRVNKFLSIFGTAISIITIFKLVYDIKQYENNISDPSK